MIVLQHQMNCGKKRKKEKKINPTTNPKYTDVGMECRVLAAGTIFFLKLQRYSADEEYGRKRG